MEKKVLPDNYLFLARKDREDDPHGGVAVIANPTLPEFKLIQTVSQKLQQLRSPVSTVKTH